MAQTIRESWLEEGAAGQMRKYLLRSARRRFGEPDATSLNGINAINRIDQLEALCDRVGSVANWSELLQSAVQVGA